MKLSGGERQRISLARAFLKNAPILILDEPTSALDLQTEASIIDALHRLVKGRTTLMIAHRPSTLRACDSRSEEHTSELQSRFALVCRLLLEKKKTIQNDIHSSY